MSHDEQIGIGWDDSQPSDAWNKIIDLIRSPEYGSRAQVIVVGILRNSARRDFAWYHYRFDIVRFDKLAHIRNHYDGDLQAGKSYVADVRADPITDLDFVIPLRIPFHYSYRIEWTNLEEFPWLMRLAKQKGKGKAQIFFTVVAEDRRQMTVDPPRWSRTVRCKIIGED
jgi:hypothetical protein